MANSIEISREDAYFLHRLLTDIIEIDGRARCSDSYFRSHFMSVIKSGLASGAYKRLDDALTAKVEIPAGDFKSALEPTVRFNSEGLESNAPVETSTEAKPKKTK